MHESHNFVLQYLSQNRCTVCGCCSCHTPDLLDMKCSDVIRGAHRTFDHNGPKSPVESDLEALYNNLTEFKDEIRQKRAAVDENEAKFIFELRRTALHWCERQWPAKQMNARQLQKFVTETARFLETGVFSDGKTEEG